jgi:hypothetical protein
MLFGVDTDQGNDKNDVPTIDNNRCSCRSVWTPTRDWAKGICKNWRTVLLLVQQHRGIGYQPFFPAGKTHFFGGGGFDGHVAFG